MVARPRPYTSEAFEAKYPDVYNSEDMVVLRENNDTYKSSTYVQCRGNLFHISSPDPAHYDDPKIDALSYATASILTGSRDISRYGKHHITDTIVGAALGTGIGLEWLIGTHIATTSGKEIYR